jgi:hypothetical protein
MTTPPPTSTFEVDIDEEQVAFFHELGYSQPNTTDLTRRAYANEYQTTPVSRAVGADRPWIDERRKPFEARSMFQAS